MSTFCHSKQVLSMIAPYTMGEGRRAKSDKKTTCGDSLAWALQYRARYLKSKGQSLVPDFDTTEGDQDVSHPAGASHRAKDCQADHVVHHTGLAARYLAPALLRLSHPPWPPGLRPVLQPLAGQRGLVPNRGGLHAGTVEVLVLRQLARVLPCLQPVVPGNVGSAWGPAAGVAGREEVGHSVLGADWLHPRHRAAAVRVAVHVHLVVA